MTSSGIEHSILRLVAYYMWFTKQDSTTYDSCRRSFRGGTVRSRFGEGSVYSLYYIIDDNCTSHANQTALLEEAQTTIIISTHYTACASHIILYPHLHDVLHLDYGMKKNNTLHLQKADILSSNQLRISPFLYFYHLLCYFYTNLWLILYQIIQNIL
jgi:hypothetical protein